MVKEQEKEDFLANLMTYQSDLVGREWRNVDGFVADIFKLPGLCDALVTELISCGYSKDTSDECDQPAVLVKEKKVSPSPNVGTICPTQPIASQTPQHLWRNQT